ncbi:MAG: DNA-processing protein DprA, partial [Flavobacteriales bacterium]
RACQELVKGLQQSNAVIVSGLAFGIDIHAHRAALEVGLPSMACLAHGLDIVYPRLHQKDAERMQETGSLVTEYPFGTNPDRTNFPSRNRLIAGLADVTVVVQSESKGGSMITAKLAHSYHRDVMAVPGSINDRRSEGCHELIQFHIASLVTSSDDIMRFMNWKKTEKSQMNLFVELSEKEEKILALIEKDTPIHIDVLGPKSNLKRGEIMSSLLSLELKGLIASQPGSSFVRS